MSIVLKEAAQDAAEAIDWLLKNIRLDAPQLSGKAMGTAEKCASALRSALAQQPAQSVNEKHFGDFELLVVTTAYEQGFGHAFRTELSNPYAPATNAYKAWDMGRSAGKRNGQPQQPATATACGIPGMAKTTCPYCELSFTFEHEWPTTPEPVGVNQLRKELSDANDFIQSLADLCVKYETLLGYRKTKAPEGASELAEARGESNVNTELDLAMPDSICDHVFVLDPKSSIRICNKCGTVECKKHTHSAPSVPATTEPVLFIHPDTFAMNNAHVGAWKPGHELTSYIPLYTHPAQNVPDDDFDLICNAIDKADTITMEGDYMLDSDDCIAVVRVMQVLLSVRAAMSRRQVTPNAEVTGA